MSKFEEPTFEEIVRAHTDTTLGNADIILTAHYAEVEEAVREAQRAENIRQIENWRDWIKNANGMEWLVDEMNDAIESLKDEFLTNEHGVYREALTPPTKGGESDE